LENTFKYSVGIENSKRIWKASRREDKAKTVSSKMMKKNRYDRIHLGGVDFSNFPAEEFLKNPRAEEPFEPLDVVILHSSNLDIPDTINEKNMQYRILLKQLKERAYSKFEPWNH